METLFLSTSQCPHANSIKKEMSAVTNIMSCKLWIISTLLMEFSLANQEDVIFARLILKDFGANLFAHPNNRNSYQSAKISMSILTPKNLGTLLWPKRSISQSKQVQPVPSSIHASGYLS